MVIRTLLWVSFLLVVCLPKANALEVTATVDRNPVMLDEAFTLTITATGDVDREAFQSDVLLKDFVVGNTSVSSQTQMVNFSTTRSTTWRTTLFPKQLGRFTIPSITIDGAQTQAIELRVIPVPTANTQEQRDFFVTAELAANSIYVQQHINYVVKLHMASNIERGSLQAPQMANARVEQVGEDEQYSDIINGKRFQVIERTFVIIPEQSGEFAIQAPIFSGEVIANNSRQSFGFFNRTQSITRRGPQLNLAVKPIPQNVDYPWLPSEFVDLSESWPEDKDFVVGEPITRTLTLTVAGQTKEQLPEITQLYSPSVKTYPDQAETASAQRNGVLVAQRTESTAIIPTEAGPMVMPGVEVKWFNTRTQQTEVVSIPARTVQVLPAATAPTPAPTANLPATAPADVSAVDIPAHSDQPQNYWWMGLTAVFACLWLATMLAWRLSRQSTRQPISPNVDKSPQEASTRKLLQVLKDEQDQAFQTLLLVWLKQALQQDFNSLHQALSHPEAAALHHQYQHMMASKLSQSPGPWVRDDFAKAIRDWEKAHQQKRDRKTERLPALYPTN